MQLILTAATEYLILCLATDQHLILAFQNSVKSLSRRSLDHERRPRDKCHSCLFLHNLLHLQFGLVLCHTGRGQLVQPLISFSPYETTKIFFQNSENSTFIIFFGYRSRFTICISLTSSISCRRMIVSTLLPM